MGLLIDNFAGAGGASLGIQWATGRPVDKAINHDLSAIRMHRANHPETEHYAEDVFAISPREVTGGCPVSGVWFSPDCTHHSKASGGAIKRSRQIRGLAWVAVKWADQVRPDVIWLENVEEFETWGPLLQNGQPDPDRKGAYFRKFVRALESHGYQVEWRLLVAADYGAPTSRKRLFLVARCDGVPIRWPEPTHGPGTEQRYRTAAECIDWSIPTVSIFASPEEAKKLGVKRPLAENTLKRIARGLQKFVIDAEDPYILDDEQTAAFMALHYTGKTGYDLRRPLNTITQRDHHTLVTANLAHLTHHGGNRVYDLREPIRTITAANRGEQALITAFLSKYHGLKGDESRGVDLQNPIKTLDTSNRYGLVAAFLLKYYGTNVGLKVGESLHTITTRDRFALVTVHGEPYQIIDIGLRMLQPHELAKAQGFPESYVWHGNKTQTIAKIGNSVPPQLVEAVVRANMPASLRVAA